MAEGTLKGFAALANPSGFDRILEPLCPGVAKAERYNPMRAARTGAPVLGSNWRTPSVLASAESC